MNVETSVNRRRFLKLSAVAGGGLVLGFYLPTPARRAEARTAGSAVFAPNAFVRIAPDGQVTVIVNKSEMGQGVYTSLPMLVAEELECAWEGIRVEPAPAHPDYYHTQWGEVQGTGGSSSVSSSYEQLRRAGATAREMLVAAAAELWSVSPDECRAENGVVRHEGSRRALTFGALADRAARMPVPEEVFLKEPEEFTVIGTPRRRLDSPAKVTGQAQFGIDVSIPGMLTAVIARPPVFGASLRAVDGREALEVPGVRRVLEVSSGVAVLAEDFWSAKTGRDALKIDWEDGENAKLSSEELRRRYAAVADEPGLVARRDGDAEAALDGAWRRVDAVYELPYLAHAPMEPLNCVAHVTPEGCDVWTGTQFQSVDQSAAAAITGLAPEAVRIHTTLLGGGFGRRANPRADFVSEAVEVAKAVQAPVKVVWTREDDVRGGYYRPMHYSRIAAGIDREGRVLAWRHRLVGESIVKGTPFEAALVKDGIDKTSVEGAADMPYAVPNQLVDYRPMDNGVPVLWWRSVGHTFTAFIVESFIDEVAAAAGRDPLELRLSLLEGHPRHRRLLELVAEKGGWGASLPVGMGRGIAVHESFGSIVAQLAEVELDKARRVRVKRVVCAVDCGMAVNPNIIESQMESSIAFGLSAALHGEISLADGRVRQSNFHDYPILRFDEMPRVETHIVASDGEMGGIGEPGTPPIAPAVCNAVFAATGIRVRRLPIDPSVFGQA